MSRRTARLGDVCEVNPRFAGDLPDDASVSFLSMALISEDGIILGEEERRLSEVRKGYTPFQRGDVLLAKITPCFENGKAARTIRLQHEVGFGSTEFHIIRAKNDISPDYIFHTVWNAAFRRIGTKNMTGSAGQKRVPADFLRSLRIPLPPLAEQRRIAAILDKADALRRQRRRALDLLDGLTQSIFLEMFGDPIANPHGLPTVPLQEVVSPERKITYGILKPGDDLPDGVPYVRVVDIRDSWIDTTALKRTSLAIANEYRRSTLRTGDLLISIRGHVGRMAIVPDECDGANITQDTARLALDGANTEFVKAQLETSAAQNWMDRRTKGAAVKGINLSDLKNFPLLLPSTRAQLQFAQRIAVLRKKASAARQQAVSLNAMFASLQHRAFTGQL